MAIAYPRRWSGKNHELKVVQLLPSDDEYQGVVDSVRNTSGKDYNIEAVSIFYNTMKQYTNIW